MLGTALDVAIGVIFIFLLFSLFLSTALEAIASMLGLRARALEITIAQLIQDPDRLPRFAHLPFKGMFGLFDWASKRPAGGAPPAAPGQPLRLDDICQHPLVQAIPCRRPAYVPSAGFASALLALLARGGEQGMMSDVERGVETLPEGRLREALVTIINEAHGDYERLRAGVEHWFDNAMDRLSGEYKRFSQAATFACALLLAIVFHLDAVTIGERLYANAALRGEIAAMATDYVDQHSAPSVVATDAPGPLDAKPAVLGQQRDRIVAAIAPFGDLGKPSFIGVLVTALAGMLGAPFWFDLLQKLVILRGAGPKPAATTKTDQ